MEVARWTNEFVKTTVSPTRDQANAKEEAYDCNYKECEGAKGLIQEKIPYNRRATEVFYSFAISLWS